MNSLPIHISDVSNDSEINWHCFYYPLLEPQSDGDSDIVQEAPIPYDQSMSIEFTSSRTPSASMSFPIDYQIAEFNDLYGATLEVIFDLFF